MTQNGTIKKITLLHFNDCYNLDEFAREPVGGAARFVSKIKSKAGERPLVVFSGDLFNPSILSTITKGEQMVPIVNACGVAVACIGNHDFDFGIENFEELRDKCNFPWLASNVVDVSTGAPLGGVLKDLVLTHEGVQIGFMGLIEQEWLTTLSAIDEDAVMYTDFIEEGRRLAKKFREEHSVDVVIALTHMRWPNDLKLAEQVPEIDLVLGGHDHDSGCKVVEPHGVCVIKSGTDFRELGVIRLEVPVGGQGGRVKVDCVIEQITRKIPPDEEIEEIVDGYTAEMEARMSNVIGSTFVDLDGRFNVVRAKESNLGNLVADVLRLATKSDVCLINSGTLRSDRIHPKGELKLEDLLAILPMMEGNVVLSVPGNVLLATLENGVSQYPKLEGRFLQVSGVKFGFDPSLPSGQRIIVSSVTIDGQPLQLNHNYRVATKDYMFSGKDGFEALKGCDVLVDSEDGPLLPTLMRNFFRVMEVLNAMDNKNRLMYKYAMKAKRVLHRQYSGDNYGLAVRSKESGEYVVAPVVEGRIVCVSGSDST